MLVIYNYFHSVNPNEVNANYLKECLSTLHNWQKISDNTFKFIPSGTTLEIQKNDELKKITLAIANMEMVSIAKFASHEQIFMLEQSAKHFIDHYFKTNTINS